MPQSGQADRCRQTTQTESQSEVRRKVECPRLLPSEAEQEPPRIKAGTLVLKGKETGL